MSNQLFREKAMDRLSSPEKINDYLRVTKPSLWVVLAAVLLLLVGALIWSSSYDIVSYMTLPAEVSGGKLIVTYNESELPAPLEPGMTFVVGNMEMNIQSVGEHPDGTDFAQAETTLADGKYTVRVNYRKVQLLKLLFN